MAEQRALESGDAERRQMLLQHFRQGEAAIGHAGGRATGALAEDESGELWQYARQRQLGQHPVDAIFRLVRFLHEQDRAGEIGQPGRAHQRRQHGEIATQQPPARLAAAKGADAAAARHQPILRPHRIDIGRRRPVERHRAEAVPAELAPAARGIGAMDGGETGAGRKGQVQRRDVGKAGQQLGIGADRLEVEIG